MSSLSSGTEKISCADLLWMRLDEIPIWNWIQITETSDLLFLFRNQNKRKQVNGLVQVWEDLQQQYLDEFGVDMALLLRVKTMKKIIKLNIQFFETRDRSILNFIDVEERRLKESGTQEKIKFYMILDHLSTHKGFRIDPKQFSAMEWFHALKNMAAHGKADKGK